ncbi:hypothetical protein AHF37_00247 [Paragonimus kellicotti]|nr:hypothetical protein AHF37_00247 [Paragonimus kellicotti]
MKMSNENTIFILNLLQNSVDSARELQLTALEQLCSLLLQTDNAEILKKEFPPSSFIPVLIKIFVDFESPPVILESAARVLTYYLQILPLESSSCLFESEGALCAICLYLESSNLENTIENDLAQQIIKMLEELVRRDSNVLKLTNCIPSVFEFISNSWKFIHLDTLRSGLFVAGRIASFLDLWLKNEIEVISGSPQLSTTSPPPQLFRLQRWIASLVKLISHRDLQVSCSGLDCLHVIITACRRLPISCSNLDGLVPTLQLADGLLTLAMTLPCRIGQNQMNPEFTQPSTNGAVHVKYEQGTGTSQNQLEKVEKHDKLLPLVGDQDRIMWKNCLKARLVSPGHNDPVAAYMRSDLPAPPSLTSSSSSVTSTSRQLNEQIPQAAFFAARQALDHLGISDEVKVASERFHQWLANSLANRANMADILSILQSGQINGCWMDSVGQPLLAWSLSTGHGAATLALCNRGADVNAGLTASAIHYAIAYGQYQCVRRLLGCSLSPDDNQILTEANTANPRLRDYQGRTPAQLGLQALASAIERGTGGQTNLLSSIAQSPALARLFQHGLFDYSVGKNDATATKTLNPGHNDPVAAYMRSDLPAPPSLTSSSSSVTSTSRQLNEQIPQAAFFAARQALDHLGISDEVKVASERFHQWLANSLANRANMADILSILQSGQINGCWMDSVGQPLLAWSLSTGHGAATLALCNRGADVNAGLTASAIHYAIAYGQYQCVRRLLGCSLSPDDNQILTEANTANPRLRDYQGRTPAQLGLQALASAIERGTGVEQSLNQARLLQEAEDKFKMEVDENVASPFANLLKLTLPVLTEIYTNSTRPEIKLRALQIIARSVRSKTGFVVLYQMQKCSETRSTDGNISASNSRGIPMCNRLVQIIAHVLSQGSAEEVFIALTTIPALIDQPYFLTWMHRHGIPDLLAWRSKLYEQEISGQVNSKDENDIVGKKLVEVPNSPAKISVREILPMCIPPYVKKPQCLYELGQQQAYNMGDWYIMRTDLNSLLLFHEFAILWLEVSPKLKLTTKTTETSVASSRAVAAEEETVTAHSAHHTINAYLITRKDKCAKSDVVVVTPLLPVGQNSSAVSATEDSGQLSKPSSLYFPNSSEAVENLTVRHFRPNSSPVDKSELANDLWRKLLPIIVQIRHMFYGMLPLPIFKSASPTSGSRKTNKTKQINHSKSPVKAPELQVPGCSTTTHDRTSPEMSNTSSPGCLISRTCATSSSIGGHQSEDICAVKEIRNLCVVQTDVSNRVTSSPVESRQAEQQSHVPYTAENLKDKFEPETSTNYLVVSDPPRLTNSQLSSGSPHDAPLSSANEITVDQSDATHQHMRVELPDLGGSFSSEVTGKATLGLSQSRPTTSSDFVNQHFVAEMTKDEQNKTEQIYTSVGREAEPEPPDYNNGLSASGKVISLHVGPIRLSLSPQGLWILIEPKADTKVHLPTTEGGYFDVCVHPECESRWNPDCSDDVMDYNGKTVQFSDKTGGLPSQRSRAPNHDARNSPRTAETDFSVTGGAQDSKYETIKILCHPTRLGGIRVYDELDKLIYQTGPITRSSGNLRLTRLLDNLSFNQKQYVRTKHRENRLKNIQQTIIRVALALSNLLKRLMSKKLISQARKLSSPLFEKHLLNHESGMFLQLTAFTDWFRSANVPTATGANRRNSSLDLSHLIERFHHATPYEILASEIIPQMYIWLKVICRQLKYNDELKHMGFVYDLKRPPNRVCLVPPETSVGNALTTEHNIFWGGVFAWLGTNGGRESKWANPLRLHGLVRMISSDSQLNADPYTLGVVLANPTITSQRARHTLGTARTAPRIDDTHSSVWIRPSETESFTNYSTAWIAFDLGVHIYLTHYMIQVPMLSDHWPELTDWQLQGSTNGITWTVLSEHHITLVGHPKFYWGNDGERLWELASTSCLNGSAEVRSWRFFRLQLLPSNGRCEANGVTLSRANSLPLRGIEFFGTVTKVFIKPDKEAQNEAYAYLGQLRSGTFVVPALPLPICGRNSYSSADKIHHERWPHLNLTEQGTSSQMASHETDGRTSTKDSTGIPSEPPLLGKVVRDLTDGYVSVQWLTGYADQLFSFRSQKHQSSTVYAMGANQRFDLRIPSEEEVRLRLKLLRESDRVKQDAENPVSSSSAMYECAANEEVSVSTPGTGVKGGQNDLNECPPNEQVLGQMVTVTSQPHPSSSLQAGTTQATPENVAMDSEELLLPETRICNGPITGPDITDHSVKLQTPVCRDHDIPETTDSSTNRCLITVKSRSNSACSSTAAHVPETLDLPENLLILPRCRISGSDDELQEMEGQIELECDSDDRDEEDELNQIDEKAGICDDHGGAQTSQTTTRMNYRPRHEDQFDAALEAIGRTLELRVLANAKEAGVRTSCPLDDDEAVTRAPKRASRRKFAKFDQWERKDPICVQTIIQQCMNLCVVSAPDATQSAAPCCSQIAHQPRDPTASSCSQLQMDGEVSSVQPPDRLSTGINMLGGGVSSNEPDEQCLYEKAIVKTDQCADTLVLPLVPPSTAPAHPPRDLKTVPRNRPTNKPILRSQCCDGIKMETIESNLDGLIPPFETRSGTSHLPSTVSFSIPARIPWPPAGLSPVDKPTTRNIDSVSSKTHVRLWLHQEQNSDAMLNPLGASSFSTLSPTSSGSTSFCSTATTKPGTPCPVTFGPTLPEVPVDPANTHQMVKFSLDKPEINLIYYLLPTFPKTTELSHPPFADEGLLDQLLDLIGLLHEFVSYRTKSPCDLQSNSVSCEWKSVDGLMEKRCDPSTSEIAHISDFGCDAFPSQQVITVPYSIDESSFHSTRLTRKLMLYANDVWSILASSHLLSNPDFQTSDCDQVLSWVPRFVMQYKFLFPFEARLEFWRVSSLGASRAIAWLQKQAGNARVSSNQQTFVTSMPSFLQRMEASSNALRDRGGFKSFGCDFSWTPSVLVVPNKDNTRSEWCANVYCDAARTVNTGNWFSFGVPPPPNLSVVTPGIGVGTSGAGFIQSTLTSLGRLQRHTTRVPRPRTANNPPERETEITTNGVEQIIVNDHPYTFFSGGNDFWSTTVRLLLVHADKHQELEVEFEGEEGTGLGPTMEFYALLSAELRRHSHGLWVSEDRAERKNQALDLIDDPNKNCMSDDWDPVLLADYAEVDTVNTTVCRTKLTQEEADCDTDLTDIEDDFYVNPPFGLFPAPWPANQLPPGTELRFYVLGIAVAKCLVDQRQMDLPFSNAFLTLLCKVVGDGERYCQNESVARSSTDWPAGVLDLLHFTEIYPERGKFVNNLIYYLRERDALKNERSECDLEAADVDLQKRIFSAELRALYIDMCFPSVTRKFGQNDFPLTKDYEPEMIELDRPTQQPEDNEELLIPSTAEAYVRRSLEFALNKGIRRQLHAFKAGFERVAPLSSLSMFTPQELGRLISGESCPNWNTTEIWANCEPAAGYNRQSKGFLLLIEGLASFDAIERRKFLRFVTGCPTLPPGGLRNLHPKLKVCM